MENIHEVLLFIKGQGGVISRYNLDRYITMFLRFDQSFNSIPVQLIEQNLVRIEIDPQDNSKMMFLTDFGSEKIDECFGRISSILSMIRSKFDTSADVKVTIPRLFLTHRENRYHFWASQSAGKVVLKVEVTNDNNQGFDPQRYHYEFNDPLTELDGRLNFIINEVMRS